MKAQEFATKAMEVFKKYFPNGYAKARPFALGDGAGFSFGLIESLGDTTNNIRENDQMQLGFMIYDNYKFKENEEISTKIVLEFDNSCIFVLPTDKYHAMSRVKIQARKINNTPEKALEALDKYFKKASTIVKEQRDSNNIYAQDRIPEKYLNSIK